MDVCTLNYTALIGRIGQYPPRAATNTKTPRTTFTLCCTEVGRDGREHSSYVYCECWGTLAADVVAFKPGDWIVMEGAIQPKKYGDDWKLVVSGMRVQRLEPSQHDEDEDEPWPEASA